MPTSLRPVPPATSGHWPRGPACQPVAGGIGGGLAVGGHHEEHLAENLLVILAGVHV